MNASAVEAVIGAATGLISGVVVQKIGKPLVIGISGGLLLFTIGRSTGCITVDWSRVEEYIEDCIDRVQTKSKSKRVFKKVYRELDDLIEGEGNVRRADRILEKATALVKDHSVAVSMFGCGFMCGLVISKPTREKRWEERVEDVTYSLQSRIEPVILTLFESVKNII